MTNMHAYIYQVPGVRVGRVVDGAVVWEDGTDG